MGIHEVEIFFSTSSKNMNEYPQAKRTNAELRVQVLYKFEAQTGVFYVQLTYTTSSCANLRFFKALFLLSFYGAAGEIRTLDLSLTKGVLYP